MKRLIMVVMVVALNGCMVPALTGIKEIKTAGGTQIKFITGFDLHSGMNGIDRVADSRGIHPGDGYEGKEKDKY